MKIQHFGTCVSMLKMTDRLFNAVFKCIKYLTIVRNLQLFIRNPKQTKLRPNKEILLQKVEKKIRIIIAQIFNRIRDYYNNTLLCSP
jgi:hypothetical protein